MTQKTQKPPPGSKEARRAEALRANLRRRKETGRGVDGKAVLDQAENTAEKAGEVCDDAES